MKKIIVLLLLAALAWKGSQRYSERHHPDVVAHGTLAEVPLNDLVQATSEQFTCDGRTYCSQMKSCQEAMYFLAHCPNTKMDGNNDGIPCEKQWCH